jgi:two-component system, NtrC family, sensor kinase
VLRGIDRHLALDDLRQSLKPFYSGMGRPSVDPELMIRMLIVGYCMDSRSAFDLQAALRTLVEAAAKLCDADKATITRQIDGVFYPAESYGFSEEFMAQVRQMPVAPERCSISGRVMLEGKAIHVEDVEADPEYWPKNFAKRGELRTCLGIPMMRNGAPIGVLALMRTEVCLFNAKQIELVQTFADQAVIAIENARLFDEVQAKTRDLQQSLEQQTASAEILRVISSSPTDVQPVFDAIAHSAAVLYEATNGTVFRLRDGLIHLVGYHSLSQAQLASVQHSFPAPLDRGPASGRAILECGVVHIRDIAADREYSAHSLVKRGLRSVLSVPMLRNGEPPAPSMSAVTLCVRSPGGRSSFSKPSLIRRSSRSTMSDYSTKREKRWSTRRRPQTS